MGAGSAYTSSIAHSLQICACSRIWGKSMTLLNHRRAHICSSYDAPLLFAPLTPCPSHLTLALAPAVLTKQTGAQARTYSRHSPFNPSSPIMIDAQVRSFPQCGTGALEAQEAGRPSRDGESCARAALDAG